VRGSVSVGASEAILTGSVRTTRGGCGTSPTWRWACGRCSLEFGKRSENCDCGKRSSNVSIEVCGLAARDFAPSVLAAETGAWFDQDYTSPFMVLVYKTKAERRAQIPAVNHVDDPGRLQTVEKRVSPRYHRLISEFARLTGVPVVLNTSFNENEPIVMTPEQAAETFAKTKMDLLVLGNHIVRRAVR